MGNVFVGLIAILSAVFYRMGGTSLGTKWRDWGCSLCVLGSAFLLGFTPTWWWALSFCLSWGALATYHSWINRITGHDTEDELWYHYFLHGLCIGLAFLPISQSPLVFVRAGILALLFSTSVFVKIDWLDEGLRGFYIGITIFLFYALP